LGWVEVVEVERDDVLRRAVDRVPAALLRAVVRVLRAAVLLDAAALRAVVFAVVALAFAVDVGRDAPELLVVAIAFLTPLDSY
jgi:hypothetical protein